MAACVSLIEANPLQFDLFTVMRRFLRERLEPTMDPANLDIQWPSNARTRLSPLGGGGAGNQSLGRPLTDNAGLCVKALLVDVG